MLSMNARELTASSQSQSLSLAQFSGFVRLDTQGNIVSAKGARTAGPVAAYTRWRLIGNMLGMEGFTSLECGAERARVQSIANAR